MRYLATTTLSWFSTSCFVTENDWWLFCGHIPWCRDPRWVILSKYLMPIFSLILWKPFRYVEGSMSISGKGQIKPKADWCAVDSPKTRTKEFVLFAFLLFTANNSFMYLTFRIYQSIVCFLQKRQTNYFWISKISYYKILKSDLSLLNRNSLYHYNFCDKRCHHFNTFLFDIF